MTTSQENLKIVKIRNSLPRNEFLNLLATYLPNIKYMFFICDYDTHRSNDEDDDTIENAVIDLSNFKSLEIFYFDIRFMCFKQESPVCFIKFQYTDGDESYYQYTRIEENDEFRSVSLDFMQDYQSSSPVSTITFKCEKIRKFIMKHSHFVEINYGATLGFVTDFSLELRYFSIC